MTESREAAREVYFDWIWDEAEPTLLDLTESAWLAGFQSAREADTMAHREAERR